MLRDGEGEGEEEGGYKFTYLSLNVFQKLPAKPLFNSLMPYCNKNVTHT